MTEKICKYVKCRLEAELEDEYCKYHKKLKEIEKIGPSWLNQMIEEMKLKIKDEEKVSSGK
jgi:hypothetical protein